MVAAAEQEASNATADAAPDKTYQNLEEFYRKRSEFMNKQRTGFVCLYFQT